MAAFESRMPDWAKASNRAVARSFMHGTQTAPISVPAPQAQATAEQVGQAAASGEAAGQKNATPKIAWPVVVKKQSAAAAVASPASPAAATTTTAKADPTLEPAAAGLPPCPDCQGLVHWRPRVRQFPFDWRCTCCDPPADPGAVDRVVVVEVDLFGGEFGEGNVARRVDVPVDLAAGLFFIDDCGPRVDGWWRRVVDGDGVERGCERLVDGLAVVRR